MVIPQLEELSKEGEYGREKINQYSRILTVPLAMIQSLGMYALLKNQQSLSSLSPLSLISLVITMVAGTVFLMWLGELISEYGIGNGISMLIFAGIVARYPVELGQTFSIFEPGNLFNLIIFLAMALGVIVAIIVVDEASRKIRIQYARRMRGRKIYGGQSTYLPLKINQAGVIPIIFAVSLILLPSMLGSFLPGIRPGQPTADYLNRILNRITLAGAIFLGLIAILPSIAQGLTGIATLTIGGTGILIVVSVILETTRQLEAMMTMRSYEGFLK